MRAHIKIFPEAQSFREDMLQELCRFGNFFRSNLIQVELLITLGALGGGLVGYNQQAPTIGTGGRQRFLPGGEFTLRVIRTSVEGATAAGFAFDDLTSVKRALDSDLLQPGLGVSTIGEIAAADEFAITTPTDDQIVTAFRASPPDGFRVTLEFGHFLAGTLKLR